ncbi:MAG: hypothetical protein ACRDGT_13850 [Candidatus Limnocylindria bacterium]
MHLPVGPATATEAEHGELPEVVPIDDLSPSALDAAAREIDEEQEGAATPGPRSLG